MCLFSSNSAIMKRIRQVRLFFQQGTSDKVYEVELCQLGPDSFTVNFRYGRRGSTLKESTKTPVPVSLVRAKTIFDKLVGSKQKKGYQKTLATRPTDTSSQRELRASKVLHYLQKMVQEPGTSFNWSPARVIWRAGELRLKEAEPLLLSLSRPKDFFYIYSWVWALGRCGSEKSLPYLFGLREDKSLDAGTQRMLTQSLLCLLPEEDKKSFIKPLIKEFPENYLQILGTDHIETLIDFFNIRIEQDAGFFSDQLFKLYLISGQFPILRSALLRIISQISLKPPFFKALRHIFKAAEFRGDAEMFGLIAYLLEKNAAFFNMPEWYHSIWKDGEYVHVEKELKKRDSKLGYSDKTRNYLRRRIMRRIRRLGEAKDSNYVSMAMAILLQYKDAMDELPVREDVQYRYFFEDGNFRSERITTWYDTYAAYPALNFILFANSDRYELSADGMKWKCKSEFKPGELTPTVREEAFPELWDEQPQKLLRLLSDSEAKIVHEFAVKAFINRSDLDKWIDIPLAISFLEAPYSATNKLGLEAIKKLYDPQSPDLELLSALLECSLVEARKMAMNWAKFNKKLLVQSLDFLKTILLSPFPDVAEWAQKNLKAQDIPAILRSRLMEAVLDCIIEFEAEKEEHAALLSPTFSELFGEELRKLSMDKLSKLSGSSLSSLQLLATHIMTQHEMAISDMPDELLHNLISSPFSEVRVKGMKFFGKLSDQQLLNHADIITAFCYSPHKEIRKEAHPIIEKLSKLSSGFFQNLLYNLIPFLLKKESSEDLHRDVYHLIVGRLKDQLESLSRETSWKLIRSKYSVAQQLGSLILENHIAPAALNIRELIRLANHEQLSIRNYVWEAFENDPHRMRQDKEEALRLLDADWEDSRNFAFVYFQTHFSDQDWTPQLLTAICDSVRPDVQAYGKEMVQRFFHKEYGTEYLLKLSQHPSAELQLFATHYLDEFASDKPEYIQRLSLYFTTVLTQINRGAIAKDRIYSFFERESLKSEQAAKIIAGILNRQSLTMAKGDKARCISLMMALKKQYPSLDMQLQIHSIPTYQAS